MYCEQINEIQNAGRGGNSRNLSIERVLVLVALELKSKCKPYIGAGMRIDQSAQRCGCSGTFYAGGFSPFANHK